MVTKQELEIIAQHFDTSKDFDSVMAYYDVLEIAKNLRGNTVLEMGSNSGTVTRYLLPHAQALDIVEGSVTGIERTIGSLGYGHDKIRYFHECWEDFEPPNQYSDVVMVRALEHVENPTDLLSRMAKWITQNGRIHIIVPNAESLHRRIMIENGELSHLNELRQRDHEIGHFRVYDKETLSREIQQKGLNVAYLSGFFVKPITTEEMARITMNPLHPFVRACYEAGKLFPDMGTQLYAIVENKS